MITIKEIAEQAGVSATTVSNVLHNKTARVSPQTIEKISSLLEKNNYIPRLGLNALTNSSSRIICVLINTPPFAERSAYERPFYGNIIGNLEKMLREKGYYIMIFSDKDLEEIEKMTLGWNVDGIIAISMPYRYFKKITRLSSKPIVAIDMDVYVDEVLSACYNVTSQDQRGGQEMAEYLISCGIRRIVYLFNAQHGADGLRGMGVRRAALLSQEKVTMEEVFLPSSYGERCGLYDELAAYAGTDTALFFSTDLNAAECISCFQRRGICVPDDISVVGFDDDIYATLVTPRITTMRVDVRQKAEKAVEILTELIEGKEKETGTYLVDADLIERESVKQKEKGRHEEV